MLFMLTALAPDRVPHRAIINEGGVWIRLVLQRLVSQENRNGCKMRVETST